MTATAQAAGQGRQKNHFGRTERLLKHGPHGSYGLLVYFRSILPCDGVRQRLRAFQDCLMYTRKGVYVLPLNLALNLVQMSGLFRIVQCKLVPSLGDLQLNIAHVAGSTYQGDRRETKSQKKVRRTYCRSHKDTSLSHTTLEAL